MRPFHNNMARRAITDQVINGVGCCPVVAEVPVRGDVMHVQRLPHIRLGNPAPLTPIAVSFTCGSSLLIPVSASIIGMSTGPCRAIRPTHVTRCPLPFHPARCRAKVPSVPLGITSKPGEVATAEVANKRRPLNKLRVGLTDWAMGCKPFAMAVLGTKVVSKAGKSVLFVSGRLSALVTRHYRGCSTRGITTGEGAILLLRVVSRRQKHLFARRARVFRSFLSGLVRARDRTKPDYPANSIRNRYAASFALFHASIIPIEGVVSSVRYTNV